MAIFNPLLERADYREMLEELLDWFQDRADAEYFTDSPSPVPNDEMRFAVRIKELLK